MSECSLVPSRWSYMLSPCVCICIQPSLIASHVYMTLAVPAVGLRSKTSSVLFRPNDVVILHTQGATGAYAFVRVGNFGIGNFGIEDFGIENFGIGDFGIGDFGIENGCWGRTRTGGFLWRMIFVGRERGGRGRKILISTKSTLHHYSPTSTFPKACVLS